MQNLTKYFYIVPHKPSRYNCQKPISAQYRHGNKQRHTDLCRIKLNQLVHWK